MEVVPDAVEDETAGDRQEGRAEDKSKGVDGDVVAHDGVEDNPGQAESAEKIDRGCVLTTFGLKPDCEEEKGGEENEGVEAFEEPAEGVRVGADERKLGSGVVDTIDDGVKSHGGLDVELSPAPTWWRTDF